MKDLQIYLIGFMGTGKSTIASKIAQCYGLKQMEMDELIEKKESMTIPEIFEKKGENYFRNIESEMLVEFETMKSVIVSCGGGVVMREQNVKQMKKAGMVVLLTASAETVYERVRKANNRPILEGNMNVEFIQNLMNQRKNKYIEVADYIVETDGKSADEIAVEIMGQVNENGCRK